MTWQESRQDFVLKMNRNHVSKSVGKVKSLNGLVTIAQKQEQTSFIHTQLNCLKTECLKWVGIPLKRMILPLKSGLI
jgi:hypothetical protein